MLRADWSLLVVVAVVAAAAALTVVLLVACALVALSARPGGRDTEGYDGTEPGTRSAPGPAVAALCVLAAGLIVGYGLYLIIA
jgi:hypothetical protein